MAKKTKKPTRTKTHITMLIDRSGSMQHIQSDVVGGVNGYVGTQDPKDLTVSVVLFDDVDRYEVIRDNVSRWKAIMPHEYVPRGMTPLWDCMAQAINAVERDVETQEIFVIFTDGEENASRETRPEDLAQLVEQRTEKDEWVFTYLGAGHDVVTAAGRVGIRAGNSVDFQADRAGTEAVYSAASAMTSAVRGARAGGQSFNAGDVYVSTSTPKPKLP
jgi:hypothetical protein